jgi:hypothetical protein
MDGGMWGGQIRCRSQSGICAALQVASGNPNRTMASRGPLEAGVSHKLQGGVSQATRGSPGNPKPWTSG